MKNDILTGVSGASRPKMVVLGANVKESMTTGTPFPTLATQLEEFTTSYDLFKNAIPSPNLSNKVNEAECTRLCDAFKVQYLALGNFVRGVAKGNRELLAKSGFPMGQEKHPWPTPDVPKNVGAFATNNQGVLMATCAHQKQVDAYIARVSTDKVNWIENFNSSARVLLRNVPLGEIVYLQMQAKNSAGRSDWSDAIETRLPAANEPIIKKLNVSIDNI